MVLMFKMLSHKGNLEIPCMRVSRGSRLHKYWFPFQSCYIGAKNFTKTCAK